MHVETSPTEEREERLDRAVVDYLRAAAAGCPPNREQFLKDHPDLSAELSRFFADQDEVARLAAPLRQAAGPAALSSSFAAFELLEEIGRGGMGVVYRAHDRALNRTVAVKMIALGASADPAALARFRNEARAAARLQHPNVVQIFEVGEHNGQPYLVLEYVEGGNLAQQLRGQPLPAEQAARLVETLAGAVHAAHQCGVIHRDLKPANVLLQFSREPLASASAPAALARGSRLNEALPKITDFGLAKQTDAEAATQTETGAILGTPGYMAPEQAEGRGRQPGPATDVYALGALLYELLTGRPPFLGASRLDTLQQIVSADPVPPRRLNATVPHDLDTICLKCLQKEQPHRYASAHDLMEDLRRFQAGEPIRARPVGRLEVAWRWCRRRPAQALLGAALLVAVVAGAALVVWQWRRAEDNYREAERLRRDAVDHEAEVDDSFRLAHEAVKDFMTQAGQRGVLDAHGLEPLRRDLLVKAQAYYRKFLQRRGRDPALRRELAETAALLADVTRQLGAPAEALAAYRHALALFEALPHAGPDSVPGIQEAVLHNHIGGVLVALGRYGEARDMLTRARKLLEKARRDWPKDVGVQREQVATQHNLALVAAASNRPEEALAAYAEARALCVKLLRARPDDPGCLASLANTLNNIGVLENQHERVADALGPLRQAAALRERLAQRFPGDLGQQFALAECRCSLGGCLRDGGQLQESADVLGKAHPLLEYLIRVCPQVTRYRLQLGLCAANVGLTQRAAGDTQPALVSLRQAKRTFRQLVNDHPTVPAFQAHLAAVNAEIAETHTRLGNDDLALRAYGWARNLQVRLVEQHPEQIDYHSALGLTLHNQGLVLHRLGRKEEARASLLEAAVRQRLALDRSPQDRRYRRWLTNDYAGLVTLAREGDRPREVAEITEKRVALWPKDAGELYAAARDCAPAAAGKDKAATRQRCAKLAVKALRLAVAAGFRDAEKLHADAALEPLRPRADFRKLLAAMAGASPAPRP